MPKFLIAALLGVAAFLMPNYDDRQTMKASEATNDRRVFGKSLVAVEFDEVFKQSLDQIQCVRPVSMSCELHALKGCSLFDRFRVSVLLCFLFYPLPSFCAQFERTFGFV